LNGEPAFRKDVSSFERAPISRKRSKRSSRDNFENPENKSFEWVLRGGVTFVYFCATSTPFSFLIRRHFCNPYRTMLFLTLAQLKSFVHRVHFHSRVPLPKLV